jgi:hypothetical protein
MHSRTTANTNPDEENLVAKFEMNTETNLILDGEDLDEHSRNGKIAFGTDSIALKTLLVSGTGALHESAICSHSMESLYRPRLYHGIPHLPELRVLVSPPCP